MWAKRLVYLLTRIAIKGFFFLKDTVRFYERLEGRRSTICSMDRMSMDVSSDEMTYGNRSRLADTTDL